MLTNTTSAIGQSEKQILWLDKSDKPKPEMLRDGFLKRVKHPYPGRRGEQSLINYIVTIVNHM